MAGRYPLGPSTLRKTLVAAFKAAGVESHTGVGWTRATVATLARKGGQDLESVRTQLGHKDAKVTLAHYDESQLREAAELDRSRALARVLDGVLGDYKTITADARFTLDLEQDDLVSH